MALDEDAVAHFAVLLRELRRSAGDPTLDALARRTGISKSVLSDAFAGKRLPTERTVVGVVSELGGDTDAFLRRRSALGGLGVTPAPLSSVPSPLVAPVSSPRARFTRAALVLATGTGVAGLLVGGVGVALIHPWASATPVASLPSPSVSPASGARVVVTSGQDPAQTTCVDDAAVAAAEDRPGDTRLEIVWSDACQAAWARISRYDGKAAENTVSASIFRQVAPSGPDRQDTTEPGVQGAYTTLLVRPTPDTRICATGEVTLDGNHVDLGAPICL